LFGGVDVEYCDVAASSRDISECICVRELRGQLCGAPEPNFLPTSDARLFCFADRERCNVMCRIFRLPLGEDAAHSSASFALVRLTISVRLPSCRLIRYMPGHFGLATKRGSSLGGLRLSVTLCGFCPSDIPMVAVTLRTASVAMPGRVTPTL